MSGIGPDGRWVRIAGFAGHPPTRAQLDALGPDVTVAPFVAGQHAEVAALLQAQRDGVAPQVIVASRKICEDVCRPYIRSHGGVILGPDGRASWEAIWP